MIGKHYREKDYHCAHFLAEWYRVKLGIEIPIVDEFEISFVRWLRRHFIQVSAPVDNCLVNMMSHGVRHVGVYAEYGVYHNYRANNKHGSVIHWDIGVVNRNYEEVTYWIWSQ